MNSRNLHLPLTSFCNAARTKFHSNDSNLVLRDLSKSGRIEESRQLFDKMPERDKFTWNTMIFAYSCSGRLADAKQLFLRNPIKNTISWSALISGYCKYGSEEEAFGFFFGKCSLMLESLMSILWLVFLGYVVRFVCF